MEQQTKYPKTPEKIKSQLENWFLKYHKPSKYHFNGTENFTLFDLVYSKEKIKILSLIKLRQEELPVFILWNTVGGKVITTTERFIMVDKDNVETIEFTEFERHKGFERPPANVPIELRRNTGVMQDLD